MKNTYIKKAIPNFIKRHSVWFHDYSNWYVGITNDPNVRRKAHGNPNIWKSWKTDSVDLARSLEKLFLQREMHGNTGGGVNADYIYVYKKYGPKS